MVLSVATSTRRRVTCIIDLCQIGFGKKVERRKQKRRKKGEGSLTKVNEQTEDGVAAILSNVADIRCVDIGFTHR